MTREIKAGERERVLHQKLNPRILSARITFPEFRNRYFHNFWKFKGARMRFYPRQQSRMIDVFIAKLDMGRREDEKIGTCGQKRFYFK